MNVNIVTDAKMMSPLPVDAGQRLYGIVAIALGLIVMTWGRFIAPWQPIPAGWPNQHALAIAGAVLFVVGGLGLQANRTARACGIGLAGVIGIFALLWIAKIAGAPNIVAYWSGSCEQIAFALGGILAAIRAGWLEPRPRRIATCGIRIAFGFCLLAFGTAHFCYVTETAAMVPGWLPPNAKVWAYITGAAHLMAGVALVINVQARLAAALTAVMFTGFGLLVWLPVAIAEPFAQSSWGGNAINLGLTANALLLFEALRGGNDRRGPSGLAQAT